MRTIYRSEIDTNLLSVNFKHCLSGFRCVIAWNSIISNVFCIKLLYVSGKYKAVTFSSIFHFWSTQFFRRKMKISNSNRKMKSALSSRNKEYFLKFKLLIIFFRLGKGYGIYACSVLCFRLNWSFKRILDHHLHTIDYTNLTKIYFKITSLFVTLTLSK